MLQVYYKRGRIQPQQYFVAEKGTAPYAIFCEGLYKFNSQQCPVPDTYVATSFVCIQPRFN